MSETYKIVDGPDRWELAERLFCGDTGHDPVLFKLERTDGAKSSFWGSVYSLSVCDGKYYHPLKVRGGINGSWFHNTEKYTAEYDPVTKSGTLTANG